MKLKVLSVLALALHVEGALRGRDEATPEAVLLAQVEHSEESSVEFYEAGGNIIVSATSTNVKEMQHIKDLMQKNDKGDPTALYAMLQPEATEIPSLLLEALNRINDGKRRKLMSAPMDLPTAALYHSYSGPSMPSTWIPPTSAPGPSTAAYPMVPDTPFPTVAPTASPTATPIVVTPEFWLANYCTTTDFAILQEKCSCYVGLNQDVAHGVQDNRIDVVINPFEGGAATVELFEWNCCDEGVCDCFWESTFTTSVPQGVIQALSSFGETKFRKAEVTRAEGVQFHWSFFSVDETMPCTDFPCPACAKRNFLLE